MLTRIPLMNGELDRFMNDVFRPIARQAAAAPAFVPAVDVREEGETILLEADVPGFKAEELKITFEKGVLTIAGERKEPQGEKAATWHRVERAWGAFERKFQLPRDVDGDAIEATYDAGVLGIKLTKKPELRPRTIEIKSR